jgi:hypothetical protein
MKVRSGKMVNWEEVKKAYEKVKSAKDAGLTTTIKLSGGGKVYSMGENNPVIRIDIKEV